MSQLLIWQTLDQKHLCLHQTKKKKNIRHFKNLLWYKRINKRQIEGRWVLEDFGTLVRVIIKLSWICLTDPETMASLQFEVGIDVFIHWLYFINFNLDLKPLFVKSIVILAQFNSGKVYYQKKTLLKAILNITFTTDFFIKLIFLKSNNDYLVSWLTYDWVYDV